MKDINELNMQITEEENSSEENVPADCDNRLKDLHRKIHEIKSNEQMGVSYMKMEERDRLIREEGERIGKRQGEIMGETKMIVSIVRKMLSKEDDAIKIADNLGIEKEYARKIINLIKKYESESDEELAEIILNQK